MSDIPLEAVEEVVQPVCVEPLFKKEFAERLQKVVQERDSGEQQGLQQQEPLGLPLLAGLLGEEEAQAPGGAAALWARQLKIAVCTQHLAAHVIYLPESELVGSLQEKDEEEELPSEAALEEELSIEADEGSDERHEEEIMEEKISVSGILGRNSQRHEVSDEEKSPTKESLAPAAHAGAAAATAAAVEVPKLSQQGDPSHFAESEALLYDEEVTPAVRASPSAMVAAETQEEAAAAATETKTETETEADTEEKAAEEPQEFSPEDLKRVRADFLQRYASGDLTKDEQAFLKELEKTLPQSGDYSMQAKNPNILATKTFSQVAIDGNSEPNK